MKIQLHIPSATERLFVIQTLAILIALFLGVFSIHARKIKTKHSIPKKSEKIIEAEAIALADSVVSISSDSITFTEKIRPAIRFYGFDKTIGSNFESFFISNALDKDITGIEIAITYLDMKGRQLHKRNVRLECHIPPQETMRTDIKSWDTQKSFYFHQSVKPKRQATPFNVKIDLLSISFNR